MRIRRPAASPRGTASEVTLALVLVAVSGAALLAAGPRLLGEDAFSGLAVEWTLSTVFGLGVATPTEQLINRRLNVSAGDSLRLTVIWLVTAGALAALAGVAFTRRTQAGEEFDWLLPGLCVMLLGWVLCAYARGRLLGAGDLRGYAGSQAVEAVSRLGLVALAVIWDDSLTSGTLAMAVGVPLVLSAGWALWHVPPDRDVVPVDGRALGREHLMFVAVALGYQFCLSGPPLLLESAAGPADVATTGAFVVASTIFRAPLILVGGALVGALTGLSRHWGVGGIDAFGRELRGTLGRVVAVAAVATVLVAALSPWVLPLLYGAPLHLPATTYVALGVSTLVAVAVSALTTALLAAGSGDQAAVAWGLGSLVLVSATVLLPLRQGVLGWGLVLAPLVALAWASWRTYLVVAAARSDPASRQRAVRLS